MARRAPLPIRKPWRTRRQIRTVAHRLHAAGHVRRSPVAMLGGEHDGSGRSRDLVDRERADAVRNPPRNVRPRRRLAESRADTLPMMHSSIAPVTAGPANRLARQPPGRSPRSPGCRGTFRRRSNRAENHRVRKMDACLVNRGRRTRKAQQLIATPRDDRPRAADSSQAARARSMRKVPSSVQRTMPARAARAATARRTRLWRCWVVTPAASDRRVAVD